MEEKKGIVRKIPFLFINIKKLEKFIYVIAILAGMQVLVMVSYP